MTVPWSCRCSARVGYRGGAYVPPSLPGRNSVTRGLAAGRGGWTGGAEANRADGARITGPSTGTGKAAVDSGATTVAITGLSTAGSSVGSGSSVSWGVITGGSSGGVNNRDN